MELFEPNVLFLNASKANASEVKFPCALQHEKHKRGKKSNRGRDSDMEGLLAMEASSTLSFTISCLPLTHTVGRLQASRCCHWHTQCTLHNKARQ